MLVDVLIENVRYTLRAISSEEMLLENEIYPVGTGFDLSGVATLQVARLEAKNMADVQSQVDGLDSALKAALLKHSESEVITRRLRNPVFHALDLTVAIFNLSQNRESIAGGPGGFVKVEMAQIDSQSLSVD